MKRTTLTICAAMLLLAACNNEKKDDKATDKDSSQVSSTKMDENVTIDSVTMQKNWQVYMTPGDMQAMLAKFDGSWTTTTTMWEAPGGSPSTSTGLTVNKMIMNGRYQESTSTGDMMGMPFEGRSTVGYDNAKKVFVSSWIDNLGTGFMNMEGTWDDASKTINFKGKSINPSTLKECDYRETFKIVDDNTQHMEMYGPGPDGKEFKMVEIQFTRKK